MWGWIMLDVGVDYARFGWFMLLLGLGWIILDVGWIMKIWGGLC